ncbi:MAG: TonB-dependent receptor [Prevotella sp.]|nr:TonB-dependent receptor [Prevotella sp.]
MKQNQFYRLLTLAFFLLAGTASMVAQGIIKITGKVVDASKEPMIGVSIQEKGTSNGTATDLDGNFTLNARQGATLVFSYVGYITQQLSARPTMNITMKEDQKELEEVVVVGYGVQKKSNVTGAISAVKDEDVSNRTLTSAEEALQGKTSGVQVITTSGMPGSVPAIRVRGYSSNSDMSPLYVVDGIIMSDISSIDVNDIASMEVLKDAASAAIYGAQAGNGVVLITTKSGKNSPDKWGTITYDFQYASNSLAHKPRMMNAREYAEFMVDAGNFSQETVDKFWNGQTDTDWFDAVYENSTMTKHNIAFSSGNEKGSVYVSAGYLSNDGMLVGNSDTFNRLNGSVKLDYKIKPWLKVMGNANISKMRMHGIMGEALNDAFLMDPLTPVAYAAGNLPDNMQTVLNNGWNIMTDDAGDYYSISSFYTFSNPLAYNASNVATRRNTRVNGNFGIELTPIKGLTFTSKLGYYTNSGNNTSYTRPYYSSAQRYSQYSSFSQTNREGNNYQWDNYLNYALTLAKKHDITAMIGHSFTRSTSTYTTGGLQPDGANVLLKDDPNLFGWLDFASSSAKKTNGGVRTMNTSESYFGRVTYGYDGKYLFQFSLRADAFDLSKLPLTNRWGYFPATSLAWVTSQEKFWKKMPKWWNYLKIRGSWGKNGSIGALNGYLYATTMVSGNKYAYGNDDAFQYVTGTKPNSMGNDELSWETSTQFDLGLDARFFNSRLNLSVDWYSKKTDDLLVTGLKPSLLAGGTFSPMNAGSVSNKGLEVELSWRDHIGSFRYGVRGNFSTLKNKVTYLSKGIDYISGYLRLNDPLTIFEEGSEVWHFYGYKFTGVDQATGEPTFEDITQDGQITTDDRTNIGSAIPSVTYGITLDAAWKGFDFILFGSGVAGNQIYQSLFSSDRTTGNRIKSEWYDDRWTPTHTDAAHPAASADISKYAISSAMVHSGAYFKIKQIQLGYTLPKFITRKAAIDRLRFYVSLEDFFTITGYKGFDPESSSAGTGSGQGVDASTYPVSKKVVLGVNLTF